LRPVTPAIRSQGSIFSRLLKSLFRGGIDRDGDAFWASLIFWDIFSFGFHVEQYRQKNTMDVNQGFFLGVTTRFGSVTFQRRTSHFPRSVGWLDYNTKYVGHFGASFAKSLGSRVGMSASSFSGLRFRTCGESQQSALQVEMCWMQHWAQTAHGRSRCRGNGVCGWYWALTWCDGQGTSCAAASVCCIGKNFRRGGAKPEVPPQSVGGGGLLPEKPTRDRKPIILALSKSTLAVCCF
jgi:hypothetical protein